MRRLGAARPRLSLVFVAMRRNVEELPQVVGHAAEWGVGRLWVQGLSHTFSDTDPAGAYAEIRQFARGEALEPDDPAVRQALDDARDRAERLGVELRLPASEGRAEPHPPGSPGCDWPWRSAYVTHEGIVQPCCMVMGADRVSLGDLRRARFAEIWRDAPYADFRARPSGPQPPEVCRGCGLYRGVH
jgi:MoaA/NifB/PqqE/SkfB family radical SAM enzyme